MQNPEWVYLNGRFVPYAEAVIPVEDRGNVLADGIYEVIRFYEGRPFLLEAHLDRLAASARALQLPLPVPREELRRVIVETVHREGLADAALYLQVSRGPAPRTHAFPEEVKPTWFLLARPAERPDAAKLAAGVKVILTPDLRWHRSDIKSISLLPNVLAKEEARRQGAFEAVFVREGRVTEGSSSNCFAVLDGRVRTHPKGPHILGGITRDLVIRLAKEAGYEVLEEAFTQEELLTAEEVFLSGTTTEVMPVTRIDDRQVGAGRPGPVTRRLQELFEREIKGL